MKKKTKNKSFVYFQQIIKKFVYHNSLIENKNIKANRVQNDDLWHELIREVDEN